MIVSPLRRRSGIASRLAQTLTAQAQKHSISSVFLTTTVYQQGAIMIYAKHGWGERQRIAVVSWWYKFWLMKFALDLSKVHKTV